VGLIETYFIGQIGIEALAGHVWRGKAQPGRGSASSYPPIPPDPSTAILMPAPSPARGARDVLSFGRWAAPRWIHVPTY